MTVIMPYQFMSRKRMIDPTIWQDEEFGSLSAQGKILFIGLFSNADDEGRIRANTAYLKSTIFMYDNIDDVSIGHFLIEVVKKMKTIQYYSIDGKSYIQLKNWDEYQKQHKDRIQSSTLPPYKKSVSDIVRQSPRKISKDKISKVKLSKDKIVPLSLTEEEIISLAEKYQVPTAFVYSKQDDVNNWVEEKPGKASGRNLKATLANWVKRDAMERRENAKIGSKISYAGDTL